MGVLQQSLVFSSLRSQRILLFPFQKVFYYLFSASHHVTRFLFSPLLCFQFPSFLFPTFLVFFLYISNLFLGYSFSCFSSSLFPSCYCFFPLYAANRFCGVDLDLKPKIVSYPILVPLLDHSPHYPSSPKVLDIREIRQEGISSHIKLDKSENHSSIQAYTLSLRKISVCIRL